MASCVRLPYLTGSPLRASTTLSTRTSQMVAAAPNSTYKKGRFNRKGKRGVSVRYSGCNRNLEGGGRAPHSTCRHR